MGYLFLNDRFFNDKHFFINGLNVFFNKETKQKGECETNYSMNKFSGFFELF